MGKLLFWIAVIVVIMFAIRLINQKKAQPRQSDPTPQDNAATGDDVESMVRCEHCGIHLPRSDAVLMHERLWCSTEHAQRGPKSR